MSVSSHMDKLDLANHSLWKAARYVFLFALKMNINAIWQTELSAGMIPRAVEQVFRVAEEMKYKGWEYKMEGQFLEIVI